MPVRVTGVDEKSPCFGLIRPFDLITTVNGTPLETADVLREALTGVDPGSTLIISLERGGQPLTIDLVVPASRSLGLEVRERLVDTAAQPTGRSAERSGYGSAGDPARAIERWEYRIEDLTITDKWNSSKKAEEFDKFSQRLNQLGGQGWELISYEAIPLVGRWSKDIKGYAYLGMLKRRLV